MPETSKPLFKDDDLHKLAAAIDQGNVVIDWDSLEKRTNVTASMLDIIGALFKYLYPQHEEGLSYEKRKSKHTYIWKKHFLPTRGKTDDLLQHIREWLNNNKDASCNEQNSFDAVRCEQNVQYYKNQTEDLQKEIALLKNQLEIANSQNQNFKNQTAYWSNKFLSLTAEKDELIGQNQKLKQTNDVSNGNILQLTNEKKDFEKKYIKMKYKYSALKAKRKDLCAESVEI